MYIYICNIKGQLGVPQTVCPWYLLLSLGILEDYNLYNPFSYPRNIGIFHGDFPRWDSRVHPTMGFQGHVRCSRGSIARLFGDVIGEQKGRDVGKGTVYTQ